MANLPTAALLAGAFRSALEPRTAAYCSGPISSGRRYLEWLLHGQRSFTSVDEAQDNSTEHQSEVVASNCAALTTSVKRLREVMNSPVINPAALPAVPGWRQSDYREFWCEIINEFAHTIVLIDGWEYSTGCIGEYIVGAEMGKRIIDEHLRPISPTRAARMLKAAEDDYRAAGALTREMRDMFAAFREGGFA